jgi:hypothetical protein
MKMYPNVSDPIENSHTFKSTTILLSMDVEDVKALQILVGFQHKEALISASGAMMRETFSFTCSVVAFLILPFFPVYFFYHNQMLNYIAVNMRLEDGIGHLCIKASYSPNMF